MKKGHTYNHKLLINLELGLKTIHKNLYLPERLEDVNKIGFPYHTQIKSLQVTCELTFKTVFHSKPTGRLEYVTPLPTLLKTSICFPSVNMLQTNWFYYICIHAIYLELFCFL